MGKDTVAPKVYYDWSPRRIQVGPLGFWRVGDSIPYEGSEYLVGSVDWDGMAIAWSTEYLEELGKREPWRAPDVLKSLCNVRTGHPINERQKEQCIRIASHGERLREEVDRGE